MAGAEPDADRVAAKSALRSVMKDRREALAPAHRAAAAARVAEIGLPPGLNGGACVVSSYWAIRPELDPDPLEDRLRAEGHRICLPAIRRRTEPMAMRLWRDGDPLIERKWGIMEPVDTAPEVDPDIMLVPLLAFDGSGYRLGYGGGYYDRTIARLRALKPVVLVGFAYDEQAVDAVPHLDYDQRLDWILTPSGARRCPSP
jgi:5-formyltetrahydrofolate cyclo-ligase